MNLNAAASPRKTEFFYDEQLFYVAFMDNL